MSFTRADLTRSPPSTRLRRCQGGARSRRGGPLTIPAGEHRLRGSARAQDAGRDGEWVKDAVGSDPIELWRFTAEADVVVRVGIDDAAYWHHEVGGRTLTSNLGRVEDGYTRSIFPRNARPIVPEPCVDVTTRAS